MSLLPNYVKGFSEVDTYIIHFFLLKIIFSANETHIENVLYYISIFPKSRMLLRYYFLILWVQKFFTIF